MWISFTYPLRKSFPSTRRLGSRFKKNHPRSGRKQKVFGLSLMNVFAVTFTAVLIIFFVPRFLIIDQIECYSQFGPCKQTIVKSLSNFEQNNLLKAVKLVNDYFSNHPLVSDYSIQFKIPNRLDVNVIEKKSVFGLKSDQNSAVALIDQEGSVVSMEETTNLPVLVSNATLPEVGQIVSPKILFALRIVAGIYSTYHLSYGALENEGLVFNLKEDLSVIFPLEGNVDVLLGSLSTILNQLNIEEQDTKIGTMDQGKLLIDLRFKNPVIR